MRDGASDQVEQAEAITARRTARPWMVGLVVIGMVFMVPIALALALVALTGNLDPAYDLGISDDLLNGLILGVSGAVTGVVAGRMLRLGPVRLTVTAIGAAATGIAIYLAFLAFGLPDPPTSDVVALTVILIGQTLAIWLGLRYSGVNQLAALAALVMLGVGLAGFLATRPEPHAQMRLVLMDYSRDGASGCRGAGALEGVGPGSRMTLLQLPASTEVGSVALRTGTVGDGGCAFDLGDPLGRPARGYADVDYHLESDPDVAYSTSLEGDQVVIRMGLD